MPAELKWGRVFLAMGAGLLVLGLLLWALVPISSPVPPYLVTPLLALAYGAWCWHGHRARIRP